MQTTARISIALVSLWVAACAPDRTTEEWRRDRVDEELQRFRAISGTYVGRLTGANGQDLGEGELRLEADTRSTENQQTPAADQQAILRGQLIARSAVTRILSFEDGAYDPDRASWRGSALLRTTNNQDIRVRFFGSVSGSAVIGRVEAAGYPESAIAFNLERTSDLSGALKTLPEGGRTTPPQAMETRYRGITHWSLSGEPKEMEMVVVWKSSASDQDFLRLVFPMEWADATLKIFYRNGETKDFVSLYFPESYWDPRVGVFQGTSQNLVGYAYAITVRCSGVASIGQLHPSTLNCDYISNTMGKTHSIQMEKVE